MTSCRKYLVPVVALALIGSTANAATFQPVGFLPGQLPWHDPEPSNQINDISAGGSIAIGWSYNTRESFLWTSDGGLVVLSNDWSDVFSGYQESAMARAISSDGEVIVGIGLFSAPPYQAIRGTPDGWVTMELPHGYTLEQASDISSDGRVIVGEGYLGNAAIEAFRWTEEGGAVGLGLLPGSIQSDAQSVSGDGTVVVGYSYTNSGSEAFVWTAETEMVGLGHLFESDTYSYAWTVSRDGTTVVGESGVELSEDRPFVWTLEEGMIPIGTEPGIARAVSADGSVVVGGGPYDSGFTGPAFIWDRTNGRRVLQVVLVEDYGLGEELAGWYLEAGTAMSDDGLTIAGYGTNPDGYRVSWVVTIPEPASVLLLGLGCVGLMRRH